MAEKSSAGTTTPKPAKHDWEAVERDYATGRYTDGELGAKHGLSREAIVRRRKNDQKKDARRWQKDLTKQVKDATNALLIHNTVMSVTKEVTGVITAGHTASAVLAAAEVSKQVILQHRTELKTARQIAMDLLAEVQSQRLLAADKELLAQVLAGEAKELKDISEAQRVVQKALATGSRVSSIKALADTLTKLHSGERVAFGLDDGTEDPRQPARPLAGLSTEELRAALRGDG